MSARKRSPILDPQPGDRLTRNGIVRVVTVRGVAASVEFHWHRVGKPEKRSLGRQRLSCWQRWARGATTS